MLFSDLRDTLFSEFEYVFVFSGSNDETSFTRQGEHVAGSFLVLLYIII